MIRQEAEASRKRAAEMADQAKFDEKRRKLEKDEKSLSDELKCDEVMLDGLSERAQKARSLAESKSANENANLLREKMKKKRDILTSKQLEIRKLLDSKLKSKK